MSEKVCIVGIAGGTASGKTTIVRRIKEKFGDDIVVINHDSYYKAHDDLSYEDRSRLNYDHPASFDTDLMIADVKKLKNNEEIDMPVYDFVTHSREKRTIRVEPKELIIVEGIMALVNKDLRSLGDLMVFINASRERRLVRRIDRDTKERGRTYESVVKQYFDTVLPMFEEIIAPSQYYADLIINNDGYSTKSIDVLVSVLKTMFL